MTWLVPQLDGSRHAGDNCGPASVAEALRWATWHEVAPTPTAVRRHMGDFEGGTTMDEHPAGFDAFTREAEAKGYALHPMSYRGVALWTDLVRALKSGRAVTLAIDYSLVPPELKCSRTFNGYHAVFLSRIRRYKGTLQIKVWDPLADGRRADVPRGPLWYPIAVLRECAEGAAKPSHAIYNVVRRADPLPVHANHPQPGAEPSSGVIAGPRP